MIQKNSIVTVDLGLNNSTSNTFVVDTVEEESVLVTHPLACGLLMRVPKADIDTTSANLKDSLERGIDYANANRDILDYNSAADLDSLGIYFTLKRKLTPSQKHVLANIGGVIASAKFRDNIRDAMSFVVKNQTLLDDFNRMWFNNFKPIFNGQHPINSRKQRIVIFNIAGYILAELENPTANRRK
jgi:hypothetical protein